MPVVEEIAVGVPVYPGRDAIGNKLPIYDSPDDERTVTLVVTPNPLTDYITTGREAAQGVLGEGREAVQKGVQKWVGFERNVEREVKAITADEPLTPGIIYVLVAGLTGSVLTRTRSFPVRFLAPPLFTLAALPYFLPKTAHNLRAYLSEVEDKAFPEFAEKHDQFNSNLSMHWHMALDKLRGAGADVDGWARKARQGIQESTGLNVGGSSSDGKSWVDQARSDAQGWKAKSQAELQHAADVAQAKLAQAKGAVKEKLDDLHSHTHSSTPVDNYARPTDSRRAEPSAGSAPVAPIAPETQQYATVATVVEQRPIARVVVPVEGASGIEPATVTVEDTKTVVVSAPNDVIEQASKKARDVVAPPQPKSEDSGKRLV